MAVQPPQGIRMRLGQGMQYLRAKPLSAEEMREVEGLLKEAEVGLFLQMSPVDQRHALAAARSLSIRPELLANPPRLVRLMRAALLHDIGKIRGDWPLMHRVGVVLIGALDLKPQGYWGRVMARWQEHAARGAHMAKLFGVEAEVVQLIRDHHAPAAPAESDLAWLQYADGQLEA